MSSPTPQVQLRLDRARVRRLDNFAARYGIDEEQRRELDGLKRRIAWLERDTVERAMSKGGRRGE